MRLRAGERCPIHGKHYGCCGREKRSQFVNKRTGPVTKLPDGREICSPAELRRRLLKKVEKQNGLCAICQMPFADIRDAVLDHIIPRGMGGANRDDRMQNLQAVHDRCNMAKGSIRNYQPPDRKTQAAGKEDSLDV